MLLNNKHALLHHILLTLELTEIEELMWYFLDIRQSYFKANFPVFSLLIFEDINY